nr:MAG TPA: Morphogenesis protein 1 hydrolase [Herelleviridae sp.]
MDAIENSNIDKPLDGMADKLREIARNIKNVNELMDKTDGKSFVSAKDINQANESTKEAIKHINDFKEAVQEAQDAQIASGKKPNKELNKTYEKLSKTVEETTENLQAMANVKLGSDASIRAQIKDMETLGKLSEEYYESQQRTISASERLKQVNATNNRVRRNLEKSEISGKMTHDQGVQTRQGLNSVGSMQRERTQIQRDIERARAQFDTSKRKQEDLSTRYAQNKIDTKEYEQERAKIEASNKAREKEIQNLDKLDKALEKTINYFDGVAREEFGTRKVDAERGSFERTWQERMPSISSHAFMGMSAFAGGLYMKGSSLSEANRPYKVSLGQQTGESNYSAVRHNFEDMSINNKLGYNSTDMLKFASDVTGSMGYKGQGALESTVKELASGGKTMGIADQEAYSESMKGLLHTGAISNGADMKELQGAFIGGLKESGMVGRNEEQLKALTSISESVGRGQTLSKSELNNVVATQGILASTGSKGLQGEQGANFMNQLNEGIRGGIDDPYTRLAMGWGIQYQGLEGRYELQKQLDKGISDPENINNLANFTQQNFGDNEAGKIMFNESLKNMGVDATIEQSDALYKKALDGKLTKEAINEFKKETESKGKEELDKNKKDYDKSAEGRNDVNKAKTDKQAENFYDLTQGFRDAHSAIAGLPTPIYLTIGALGAFMASLTSSAMIMKGVSMMRGAGTTLAQKGRNITGKGNTKGGGISGGNSPKGGGNNPKGGGGIGGFFTGLGSTFVGGEGWKGFMGKDAPDAKTSRKQQFNSAKGGISTAYGRVKDFDYKGTFDKAKGGAQTKFGSLKDKAGGLFSKAKGGGKTPPTGIVDNMKGASGKGVLSKLGGLGKYGKGLGIAGAGLSALSLVPMLMNGDKEGITKGVSSIGGGAVGASIGGSIGALFGGVGAIPGSIVGGTIGSIAGDKFGGFVNDTNKKYKEQGLFGFTGMKEGLKGSLLGKALGGIKGMFGVGKDDATSKGGGGGGGSSVGDKVGTGGSIKGTEKDTNTLGAFKNEDGSLNRLGRMSGALGTLAGVPMTDFMQGDEGDNDEGKNKSFFGVKKDTNKKKRVESEKLREKNNESETKNLKTYKSLLDRFEQLIQEAKSLDLEGGSSGDSEGGDDGVSASDVGGKGSKKIWNFFKEKGLSNNQIGAIIGNLQQESNLDPNATNPSSGAYGIAQWLGGRKTNLQNFAKSKGKKASDMDVQLDFLWKEMQSDYEKNSLKNAGWSKNASLEKNTSAFAYGFERMGANEAMMNKRVSGAKSAVNKFGGGGGGGGSLYDFMSTPPVQNTYNQPQNNKTVGDTTNNVNVSINVDGSQDPQTTAQAVSTKLTDTLEGLDIFSNEYRRV